MNTFCLSLVCLVGLLDGAAVIGLVFAACFATLADDLVTLVDAAGLLLTCTKNKMSIQRRQLLVIGPFNMPTHPNF